MSTSSKPPRTRLFVKQPLSSHADIHADEKQSHYLAHVMRYNTGDIVSIFNGNDGEWLAEITAIGKKSITLSLLKQLRRQKTSPDIWLLAAPLRAGKTEYVIEKATELGISRFVPISTQHTVATSINQHRLEAIAIEAAEQCERMDVPVVSPLIPLAKLLDSWDKKRIVIYGDESGVSKQPNELFPSLTPTACAVLIGPEGGFSPEELDLLRQLDYTTGICMGPRILRADTAAIAAVTLVQSWFGDWDNKPAFRNNQGTSHV